MEEPEHPAYLDVIGYLLIVIVAAMLYALMSAFVKAAVVTWSPAAVLVARYLFACAALAPIYFATNRPGVSTKQLRWHLARGAIGFCMFSLYTLALKRIPLQNVIVLNSSYVLFVPLLLLIFMHQRPGRGAVFGLAGGFIGIAIVSGAHAQAFFDWGSILALGSAVASATAFVVVAKLRTTDSSFTVLFYFFSVSLGLSVLWAIGTRRTLSVGHWWPIIAVGVLTAVYQLLLTFALKHLSSVLASSAMTSSVVFGFFLNAWMFHRVASMREYVGSALILSGVLVTLWASHRSFKAKQRLDAQYLSGGEMIHQEVLPP